VVNQLALSGNASSTQSSDGSDVSAGSTPGELVAGDVLIYINDPNGLFTSDELARIQDAVNSVDALVEPYGITVAETTDSTAANVTLDTGSTSAAGGYANGVLGCWNPTGEITMIQGWNWYAGSDATKIGSNQYDFETTLTHELGHAIGLGESSNAASAMSGTLATGTVIRALTTADLSIPEAESGADAQRAAIMPASGDVPSRLPGINIPNRDALFALLMKPAGAGALAPTALLQTSARDAFFADSSNDLGTASPTASFTALNAAPIFGAPASSDSEDDLFASTSLYSESLQEGSGDAFIPPESPAGQSDARSDFISADGVLVIED
jgi:hypothetical protein